MNDEDPYELIEALMHAESIERIVAIAAEIWDAGADAEVQNAMKRRSDDELFPVQYHRNPYRND